MFSVEELSIQKLETYRLRWTKLAGWKKLLLSWSERLTLYWTLLWLSHFMGRRSSCADRRDGRGDKNEWAEEEQKKERWYIYHKLGRAHTHTHTHTRTNSCKNKSMNGGSLAQDFLRGKFLHLLLLCSAMCVFVSVCVPLAKWPSPDWAQGRWLETRCTFSFNSADTRMHTGCHAPTLKKICYR